MSPPSLDSADLSLSRFCAGSHSSLGKHSPVSCPSHSHWVESPCYLFCWHWHPSGTKLCGSSWLLAAWSVGSRRAEAGWVYASLSVSWRCQGTRARWHSSAKGQNGPPSQWAVFPLPSAFSMGSTGLKEHKLEARWSCLCGFGTIVTLIALKCDL